MMSLSYDEVTKICFTHSFNNQHLNDYAGQFDVSQKELEIFKNTLNKVVYNDYDKLICLCDALAGSESILDIEKRMSDVKARYGYYPQKKWDTNMHLKAYFEAKSKRTFMK